MSNKINVLLVCSGNRFRSISAAKLLEQHLADIHESRFAVKSAGTNGDPAKQMHEQTVASLKNYGVDTSSHESTKLTTDHIEWADTILAMADYHQEYIQNNFSAYAHLYKDFAVGKEANVDDINDLIADYETNEQAVRQHIMDTIEFFHEVTPKLVTQLQNRHFFFKELADRRRDEHLNGAEFEPLLELQSALAFLGLDVPYQQNAHVIIIPKERYIHFHKIPMETKMQMNDLATRIGETFQKHHGGYNLLLNNGRAAGQHFYHAHMHVIPRDLHDGVSVEVWEHHRESPGTHRQHHERLEKLLTENGA